MLDSSTIRRLILKIGRTKGQLRDLREEVSDLAVQGDLLSHAPHPAYDDPLWEKISTVMWALVIEGVYSPAPNFPFFTATDHGLKCFQAGELMAHDPDDYLRRLKLLCPTIDETTLLYTGEALDTFRTGNHLASVVMIGVAAENMLLRLVEATGKALNTPQRQEKFVSDTRGKKAKVQHDQVLARLRSPATPLPEDLESVLTSHVDSAYDLIRRTRNDAGHPTGRRMELHESHALLLLFPTLCKTLHELMEWLGKNVI